MAADEHDQAELLAAYWAALDDTTAATPPLALDVAAAAVIRRLTAVLRPPEPDPAFAARLRDRLDGQATMLATARAPASRPATFSTAASLSRLATSLVAPRKDRTMITTLSLAQPWAGRHTTARPWPRRAAFGAACAVVLAVCALIAGLVRPAPQPASAAEIIQKARGAVTALGADSVHSFMLTEVTESWPATVYPNFGYTAGTVLRGETRQWYTAPNRWRVESRSLTSVAHPSLPLQLLINPGVYVSNGTANWTFAPKSNTVTITPVPTSAGAQVTNVGQTGPSPLDQGVASLTGFLRQVGASCYTPQLLGRSTVAGRATYVVDLGSSLCPSASVPETNGRRVVWVDQQTFFVLKTVQYASVASGSVYATTTVTHITYNTALPAGLFTYTPPRGAHIVDLRSTAPVPRPTGQVRQPGRQALGTLRRRLPFPVFVPAALPVGIRATLPTLAGTTITISYVRGGAEVFSVLEGPAGCCLDADPRKGGQPLALPHGVTAHLLSGGASVDGSILWWDQQGTYLALANAALTRGELLRVAASMSRTADLGPTVQPAPPPAAGTLGFPILRPTWWPAGLTAREEHRVAVHGLPATVSLTFDPRPHAAPHDVLTLTETKDTNGAGVSDPAATHQTIGGRAVTVVHRQGLCTAVSWVQDGVALVLTNAYDPPGHLRYTCDQLFRTVASTRPAHGSP